MSPLEWWKCYSDAGARFAAKARDESKPAGHRKACQNLAAIEYGKARQQRDAMIAQGVR